jgi:hypothetical protein
LNSWNIQVLRTDGDKEMLEMEALSLIILELNYSTPKPEHVQVQICWQAETEKRFNIEHRAGKAARKASWRKMTQPGEFSW